MNSDIENQIKSLKESFAVLQKETLTKLESIKATPDTPKQSDMMDMYDSMCRMIGNVHDRLDRHGQYMDEVHAKLQDHKNSPTHVPALTPTQMNKLMKMVGADGDYQVQPKIIATKRGDVIYM